MQMNAIENFRVLAGEKIDLKDYDPCWIPEWALEKEKKDGKKAVKKEALGILEKNREKLSNIQELFWANDTYALLIILQGMDAAGKDGVIRSPDN